VCVCVCDMGAYGIGVCMLDAAVPCMPQACACGIIISESAQRCISSLAVWYQLLTGLYM